MTVTWQKSLASADIDCQRRCAGAIHSFALRADVLSDRAEVLIELADSKLFESSRLHNCVLPLTISMLVRRYCS